MPAIAASRSARSRASGRPGIVHRLDKETSGLIVVAKTDAAQASLMRQFGDRSVEKEYLALVRGEAPASRGRVEAPIGRDPRDRQRMAVVAGGRASVTEYEQLAAGGGYALLALHPLTGRTHQIRAHLAYLGLPIAGDMRYGGGEGPGGLRRQFLHAARLGLEPPARRRAAAAPGAQLPPDLAACLDVAACVAAVACQRRRRRGGGAEADHRSTQDKRMTFPNPMLVVVSGPSGVGKSTIVAELARRRPQVVPIVTATTREQRHGEIDGVHYHFLSDDEFAELRRRDGLLEHADNHGHWYGTPIDQVRGILAAGRDAILTISPEGARNVRRLGPGRAPDLRHAAVDGGPDRAGSRHAAPSPRRASSAAAATPSAGWPRPTTTTTSSSTRPGSPSRRPSASGRSSRPRPAATHRAARASEVARD